MLLSSEALQINKISFTSNMASYYRMSQKFYYLIVFYAVTRAISISIALEIYIILTKNTQDGLKNTDKLYTVAYCVLILFTFHLSNIPICTVFSYSDSWMPLAI